MCVRISIRSQTSWPGEWTCSKLTLSEPMRVLCLQLKSFHIYKPRVVSLKSIRDFHGFLGPWPCIA